MFFPSDSSTVTTIIVFLLFNLGTPDLDAAVPECWNEPPGPTGVSEEPWCTWLGLVPNPSTVLTPQGRTRLDLASDSSTVSEEEVVE
jgi:hypothetical protein